MARKSKSMNRYQIDGKVYVVIEGELYALVVPGNVTPVVVESAKKRGQRRMPLQVKPGKFGKLINQEDRDRNKS